MAGNYDIRIEKAQQTKLNKVDFDNLEFGAVYSDHMFVSDFYDGRWQDHRIIPFQKISMSPATSVLHYSQSIFEGFKAYKNDEGTDLLLFRPDAHAQRLQKSSKRMVIPEIPEDLFLQAVEELVKTDQDWIPSKEGCSLYIRPFIYASDEFIGVRPSETYKFIIFTCPVAGYYKGTVKVKVETEYVRAAEGGVGSAKAGANYAASLYPAMIAEQQGYHQLLWTDSKEHKYFEESGTMNIMFQIGDTIITPPLSSSILPGITRESVIRLLKSWDIPVEERKISIDDVMNALENGTLKDAFGTGTAATITHIDTISYNGRDYSLPPIEEREISTRVKSYLSNLKLGHAEDSFDWVKKISLTTV